MKLTWKSEKGGEEWITWTRRFEGTRTVRGCIVIFRLPIADVLQWSDKDIERGVGCYNQKKETPLPSRYPRIRSSMTGDPLKLLIVVSHVKIWASRHFYLTHALIRHSSFYRSIRSGWGDRALELRGDDTSENSYRGDDWVLSVYIISYDGSFEFHGRHSDYLFAMDDLYPRPESTGYSSPDFIIS
jgi:hypothetical protein